MRSFSILTDTGCDIAPALLAEWQVKYVDLTFTFVGDDHVYYNGDLSAAEFYQRMREGMVAKTAAVNMQSLLTAFEAELKAGQDVLYLSFSGGLSTSAHIADLAARELAEQYPERRLAVVDSLCASAGQGLFVYLVAQKRREGADLAATEAYARQLVPSLCHWFTVDDLVYLKRGGRVSAASALAGAVLQIKPVLHVDDEGHLINVQKVRGRRQSIRAMAERYFATALDQKGTYFISHGDCLSDAKELERLICEKTGRSADLITDIGSIIGAHSGPGTLALFFLGTQR